jgi:hypothetical protein
MTSTLGLLIMPANRPYLSAALVCEHVLTEQDGVHTLVRVVDTFFVHPTPDNLPPDVLPGFTITLFVSLKSGEVQGDSQVEIKLSSPSGRVDEVGKWPVTLNGGDHGVNLLGKITVPVREFGLHWFDVYWEGMPMTRVPVKILRAADAPK